MGAGECCGEHGVPDKIAFGEKQWHGVLTITDLLWKTDSLSRGALRSLSWHSTSTASLISPSATNPTHDNVHLVGRHYCLAQILCNIRVKPHPSSWFSRTTFRTKEASWMRVEASSRPQEQVQLSELILLLLKMNWTNENLHRHKCSKWGGGRCGYWRLLNWGVGR